jgi:hypothetical protein
MIPIFVNKYQCIGGIYCGFQDRSLMKITGSFETLIYTCLTRGCHNIGECRYVTGTDEKYIKYLVMF